ncbi:MAG: polysaccharide deacetylase, partial [Sphingomonadales bacterium]
LALGRDDKPLGPSMLRTRLRQAEQLWSNLIEERAA